MIKWPWHLLTNEGEAKILLREGLRKAPSLRAHGLTGDGDLPDLRLIAACNDFLLPVRLRDSVDDRTTAVQRADALLAWVRTREFAFDEAGLHGALIACALGRGAAYLQCGDSCYLNLRSRDFADRLLSISRQVSR